MVSLRTILLISTLLGLLVGCTRSRSSEPTATEEAELVTVITGTVGSDVTTGAEPVVTIVTPAAEADVTATETVTPEPIITPSTIDYYVQDGDTLSSVATKFDVSVETVRRMNYLLDDNIYVGQILQMPNVDGVTAEGAPTATPAPYRYQVVAGDSLGGIAIQFGVSTVALMEANNMSNPDALYVGQELVIPGYSVASESTNANIDATGATEGQSTSSSSATSGESVSHIVQPGDTLYGIAQSYGVEAAAIVAANNIANGNQLRAGQKIIIPGISAFDAAQARGRVHVVQSGESLTAIAVLYGATAQEIIEFNGISNPDAIYVGQQLIIPGQ